MAVKSSNQITFTEQKKILQIKEWYIAIDSDNILTDTEEPPTATEGQLWFNKSNDNSTRLMQFVDGGWGVCPSQFTESMQKATSDKKYLWNYEEVIYSIGESEISNPVIVGTYGSVSDIINYYTITQDLTPPGIYSSVWTDDFKSISGNLSSINKYLWNYEIIVYADGTSAPSQPAIIGIYGDSGEDAVTFQIYSIDGFEFIEDINEEEKLETITLQLSAYEGSKPLTENIEFTWSWWNPELNSGEGDTEIISTTTSDKFEVNINDPYAFANLECVMTYNGESYKDYVMLKKKTDVYSASIKFFNGTNVIARGEEYVIGYVELYKNNKTEETIKTTSYYSKIVTLNNDNNTITTDYIPKKEYVVDTSVTADTVGTYWIKDDNENYISKSLPEEYDNAAEYYTFVSVLVYFICQNDNVYDVILGEYDPVDDKWTCVDSATNYIYANNVSKNLKSNVFVVFKKDLIRSQDVDVDIYSKLSDTFEITEDYFITTVNTTIIDINDTVVSSEFLGDPSDGQLWFNTSTNTLQVYNAEKLKWEPSSIQYTGQTIYTTRPESYKEGDLWVVEDAQLINGYMEVDVTSETTGEYWVIDNNMMYTKVTLPDDYNSETVYYTLITYETGAILKANSDSDALGKFNPSHWDDATPKITTMQSNIEQYFDFNKKTGLKVGQIDQKFYVNISSTRMSFCENPDIKVDTQSEYIPEHEVVHIGNSSATIKNLIVEESADCNCPIEIDKQIDIINTYSDTQNAFPGFTFQIEPDGGFSLVKMEVN